MKLLGLQPEWEFYKCVEGLNMRQAFSSSSSSSSSFYFQYGSMHFNKIW